MPDLADTPGYPAQAGSGPGQKPLAIKCCLPENVFQMVIAGHMGPSRDRSWPRLLTRNSYRLPVSATAAVFSQEAGRSRECISDLGPGRLSRYDLRAVTHSATLRRPCAWLLVEFLTLVRTWPALYPALSYMHFVCRLHGLPFHLGSGIPRTQNICPAFSGLRGCAACQVRDGRACCLWSVLECAHP